MDASGLYWTNGSGYVDLIGQDGKGRVTVASGEHFPKPITLDAGHVHWGVSGDISDPVVSISK